jgi:hypothetical protein
MRVPSRRCWHTRVFAARAFAAVLFWFAAAAVASTASAQAYKVETATTPAPQELAAGVHDMLSVDALRVSGAQGIYCELWLRKAVPVKAATQGLGIAYGQLSEGEFVGAIRFASAVKDFRGQAIKPGVYTLRYMLQPVDGNHQGVSPYRDFLLLASAALDSSPAVMTTSDLTKLSRRVSGTGHPAVWSLIAADGAPVALPAVAHQEDGDLWVLYFHAPLAAEGSPTGMATIGLVIAGHAPEI